MKSITYTFLSAFSLCFIHEASAYPPNYSLIKSNRKNMHFEVSNSKLIIPGNGVGGDDPTSDEPTEDAFGAAIGPMPTSSKVNYGDETPKNLKYDLWIVGTGTLGTHVAKQWKIKYPDSKIIAETSSNKRHAELQSLGVIPQVRSARQATDDKSCKNVLICIPPSSPNYLDEVNLGTLLWAGPLGPGKLVLTSTTGVYGDSFGNMVNETFRVDSRTQRTKVMISAEESVLERDGYAVRLAGLYDSKRGPHTYWMTNGTVQGSPDTCLNMLHYEDAARAVIACMECRDGSKLTASTKSVSSSDKGHIFLVCDDLPMSRKEICETALQSGLFANFKLPQFTAEQALQTKICDDSYTRRVTGWKPLFPSFGDYMLSTIGGSASRYTPPTQLGGKPRPSKPTAASIAAQSSKEAKKSALWIPGDEDDLL